MANDIAANSSGLTGAKEFLAKWKKIIIICLIALIAIVMLLYINWPDDNFGEDSLKVFKDNMNFVLGSLIFALVIFIPVIRVLNAVLEFFNENLTGEIKQLLEKEKTRSEKLLEEQQKMLAPGALKYTLETISHEDGMDILPILNNKIYGSHCLSPKGLYKHIDTKLAPFLHPEKQHFSSYNKSIFISEEANGKLKHNEFTTYSIHLISLDDDYTKPTKEKKVKEYIEYTATNEFETSESIEDYLKNSEFSIAIRDDSTKELITVFSLEQMVVSEDGQSAEYNAKDEKVQKINANKPHAVLKVLNSSDSGVNSMILEMNCKYKAETGNVFVRTEEASFIEDDNYRFTFSKPSCECSVTVVLPESYKFKYAKVTNNCHWETSIREDGTSTMANIFKAHTKEWVLPGLVFACAWEEKK